MVNIATYLDSLITKLASTTLITDTNNIIVGETQDVFKLSDTQFPRLEILVAKDKCDGYVAQRKQNYSFRYSIMGMIKRTSMDTTKSDMLTLMGFGIQVRALNYQFLDDKQAGNPPSSDFTKMGEFPECFYEFEMYAPLSAFLLDMEAHFYLSDTEGV
jgi:hypothetical protein